MKSFLLPKTLLLALAAFLLPLSFFAATETVNGIEWNYTVTDGKATITSGTEFSSAIPTSTSGPVTVPSTLGGYPVTAIGEYAFYDCSELTSFTIPDGVTSLGKYAFCNCSGLVSFTIPDGVTSIEMAAFGACWELTSITIPNLVTNIGDYAFYNCNGLTSVTIADSVSSIGDYAFYNCNGLTTVTIPESVSSIGNSVFSGCWYLMAIFIPESLAAQSGSWNLPSSCQIVEGIGVTVEDVSVPKEWIFRRASPALAAANGDWAATARATAANGVNKVWECYMAGLDPASATNRFLANLVFDGNGVPSVSWSPDLGAERIYVVDGKASLTDEWGAPNDGSRFFRVRVALPGNATITFDSAGGSGVASLTATVGSAIAAPTPPTRTGYTFAGWSPAFPAKMPLGGATLTAQWTPISYAVRFNANGGNGTMADESFAYGTAKALTANAFTRPDLAFSGWATSANGPKVYNDGQTVLNLTSIAGATVDLYAVWEERVDHVYYGVMDPTRDNEYNCLVPTDPPSTGTINEWIQQNQFAVISDDALEAKIQIEILGNFYNGNSVPYYAYVIVPQTYINSIAWVSSLDLPQNPTVILDGTIRVGGIDCKVCIFTGETGIINGGLQGRNVFVLKHK